MRLEFGDDVPLIVQLMRTAAAKKPGRKHQKRPGVRATERRKAQAAGAAKQRRKLYQRRLNAIRAYWAGEAEENPSAR